MFVELKALEVSIWKRDAAAEALERSRSALDLPASVRIKWFRVARHEDFERFPFGSPQWKSWPLASVEDRVGGVFDPAEPTTLWISNRFGVREIVGAVHHEARHAEQKHAGRWPVLTPEEREAEAEGWAAAQLADWDARTGSPGTTAAPPAGAYWIPATAAPYRFGT